MIKTLTEAAAHIRGVVRFGGQGAGIVVFETQQEDEWEHYMVDVFYADIAYVQPFIEARKAPGGQRMIGIFDSSNIGSFSMDDLAIFENAEPCAMTFIKQEKQREMRL